MRINFIDHGRPIMKTLRAKREHQKSVVSMCCKLVTSNQYDSVLKAADITCTRTCSVAFIEQEHIVIDVNGEKKIRFFFFF